MKKTIAFIALCLVLLSPVIALCDVLALEWNSESLDSLIAARSELDTRISELRAAQNSTTDNVMISGNGTSIKTNVVVPFAPSRVKVSGDVEIKITGGEYEKRIDATYTQYSVVLWDEKGTFTILAEGNGDWTVEFEQIVAGDSFPMNGEGPFVSDFFELTTPMILTINIDYSGMTTRSSSVSVQLNNQYKNIESWDHTYLVSEFEYANSDPYSADVIIQPTKGRDQYCISVECSPGVKWSIEVKP